MKKIFVLDTNVILHDSACIYQFGDHDIIIPITVIEELDRFKKETVSSTAMIEIFYDPWMHCPVTKY